MKPTKKPELRILKKSADIQPPTEEIPPVAAAEEPVAEPPLPEVLGADYLPAYEYPLQSVGNTGWQVSDIWRDLRVDDFCN